MKLDKVKSWHVVSLKVVALNVSYPTWILFLVADRNLSVEPVIKKEYSDIFFFKQRISCPMWWIPVISRALVPACHWYQRNEKCLFRWYCKFNCRLDTTWYHWSYLWLGIFYSFLQSMIGCFSLLVSRSLILK